MKNDHKLIFKMNLIGILFAQVTIFTQRAIASVEFPAKQQDVDP